MRAAVLHAAKDLRIEAVAAAPLGPGEVEVRIEAGGICGSDLHYYFDGGFGTVRLQGADDPRPRDRRHGRARRRGGREREAGPARRRQPEPPVRRLPLLPGGQAASTASTCASTAARCAFRMCRAAFARCWCATPRRPCRCRAAMSAAQAAFAEPFAVCLHAVNRAGPPARQARAGHRRRPDRRAHRDRGAARGRARDRRDRRGGCAARCGRAAVGADATVNVTEKDALARYARRQGLFRRDVRGLRQRAGARRRRSPSCARWASSCRSASRAAR